MSLLQLVLVVSLVLHSGSLNADPGIPHMVTEEDEYPGYRIPKGTTILGNTWHVAESEQSLVFTLFI